MTELLLKTLLRSGMVLVTITKRSLHFHSAVRVSEVQTRMRPLANDQCKKMINVKNDLKTLRTARTKLGPHIESLLRILHRGKFLCDVCSAYYALPISAIDLVHVSFGHNAGCRSLIRQISIGFHKSSLLCYSRVSPFLLIFGFLYEMKACFISFISVLFVYQNSRGGQSAIKSAKRNLRNLRNCGSCAAL